MKSLILALFCLLAAASGSLTAEVSPMIKDGTLIIQEVKEVRRIPNVPKGLTAEEALKLVEGELTESVIEDKLGKREIIFSYPLRERKTFSDRSIGWQGKWVEKTVYRFKEGPDWALTFLWLIVPALGILIVSLANQLTNSGSRKLLVFYAAIIAGVLAGGLAGAFAGGLAGVFAGGLAGVFAGGLAGGLAGELAGGLAGEQGFWIVSSYLIFIVAAEIASFVIAKISAAVKGKMPAVKKWLEA